MEQDQEMHAHPNLLDQQFSSVYPHDLNLYDTPASFLNQQAEEASQPLQLPQDAFRSHDHHEAGHVYNLLPLALDPSALDLHSNFNHEQALVPAGPSDSLNTTPTGSLRLPAYNPHELASPARITRRRDPLDQLQLQVETESSQEPQVIPPHQEQYDDPQHQPSDMQSVSMHATDVHMHLNDTHGHTLMSPVGQEQGHSDDRSRMHSLYSVIHDTPSHTGFYVSPEAFTNSPTNSSATSDASPHSDFQTMAPMSSSTSAVTRPFRSTSLSLARPISLMSTSPLSPPHLHQPSLSSHPHMHPSPYYPVQHNPGSPGYPTTPITSHHAQNSSSSSHSSGHTRYSFRGSPVPRSFGRGHSRSDSYGTLSTISVRSSSPASSVTSGFTSLSGGPGSAPPSTAGTLGSPISYGECGGDVHMPYGGSSPTTLPSPTDHTGRSQSHPPLSMPAPRSTLTFPSLMHPTRKSHPETIPSFPSLSNLDPPADITPQWARPPTEFVPPSSTQRLSDEAFQTHYAPRQLGSRAPHRKQKLANSDRKAICLYARNHPSARQEDIAARYNVERSTISKILKNKERWLGCTDDDTKVPRKRKPRFDDLELVLTQWVENPMTQKLVLSDALIRSKAKDEARRLGIPEDKFKASSGWLENFKHRVGIRKGKYIGLGQGHNVNNTTSSSSSNFIVDRNDTGAPRIGSTLRTAWTGDDKPLWQEDQVQPKQEEESYMLHPVDASFQEPHASGQVDVRPVEDMRKTRSRTLAEARQSQPSSSTMELPSHVDTAHRATSFGGHADAHSPMSASSPSSREASAGLDTALDFIDTQGQGYATAEEVQVLKNLKHRMSRTDFHSPSSSGVHSDWTGAGEA